MKSKSVDSQFGNLKRIDVSNILNASHATNFSYLLQEKNRQISPSFKSLVLPNRINLPSASNTFPSIIYLHPNRFSNHLNENRSYPEFYYNQDYVNGDFCQFLAKATLRV